MRFPRLLGALLAGCGFNAAGIGCGEDALAPGDAQEQADAGPDAGQSEADAALADAAIVDAGPDAGPDAGDACDLQAGCDFGLACHLGDDGWTYCLPAGSGNSGSPCVTDGDCGWGGECQGDSPNRRCRSIMSTCGLEESSWAVGFEELGGDFHGTLGVCFQSCHLTGPSAGICGYPPETCPPVMPPHIYMGEEWGVCR